MRKRPAPSRTTIRCRRHGSRASGARSPDRWSTQWASVCAGMFQTADKRFLAIRQPKRFEPGRPARRILADEHEVARVGHQHQPVALPVAAHLTALRREPCVVARGLHFDHAALRRLPLARAAFLHLLRRVQAEIGVARALLRKLRDAKHLGFQRAAHGIEQSRQRRIVRPLPRSRRPRSAPVRDRRSTSRPPPSVSCSFRSSSLLSPSMAQFARFVRVEVMELAMARPPDTQRLALPGQLSGTEGRCGRLGG